MLDGTEYLQWMQENIQCVCCSKVHTASVLAWLRWLGMEVAVDGWQVRREIVTFSGKLYLPWKFTLWCKVFAVVRATEGQFGANCLRDALSP